MRSSLVGLILMASTVVLCQDPVIAVLMNSYSESQPATQDVQKSLLQQMSEQVGLVHQVYMSRDGKLVFVPEMSTDTIEQAVDYLLKYDIELNEDYTRPPFNRDGNTFIMVNKSAGVNAVLIDLRTNVIVSSTSRLIKDAITGDDDEPIATDRIFTVDWEKYSKSSKTKAVTIAKMHKAMRPTFEKFMRSKGPAVYAQIILTELSHFMPPYLEVTDVNMKEDKAKGLSVKSAYKVKLPRYSRMSVFTVDTLNGLLIPNLLGYYGIKKQDGRNLSFSSGFGSKAKVVGEAHLSGKKLYTSFDKVGYSGPAAGLGSIDRVKVGVRSANANIAMLVASISKFVWVMQINDPKEEFAEKFRERNKQERFIGSAKEPNLIGADYIVAISGKNYDITSVETSELLHSYPRNRGIKGFVEAAMSMTGLEMEIFEVTKQSKRKINRFQLFNPWGFNGLTRFNMFVIEEENIGGEVRERKVHIGTCVSYQASGMFASFIVKEGESDLSKAFDGGKKIIFRYYVPKYILNASY